MSKGHVSRAERARLPLARSVIEAVAVDNGVCVRPVPIRRVDVQTGESKLIDVPCGATLAAKCPSCAERARRLRLSQCREGWHLTEEPIHAPDPATDEQRELAALRADLEAAHAQATDARSDVTLIEAAITEVDTALGEIGIRGSAKPGRSEGRRVRSTKRRQDTPDLPRRPVQPRTTGTAYGPEGRTVWPSLFVTLTLDSYGRVHSDGTPVDPDSYDYRRAARDAIHFPRLVDRFVQNLRRFVGWDVQYFASVEPQRRLAPHLHLAMRGTVSRAELRQVAAATYHQVWWPACEVPVYGDGCDPVWDADRDVYVDPESGEPLSTWDEALDSLDDDPDAEPVHVARLGRQVDAQGVLAGTPDAGRCLGYLAKYLTKSVSDCHAPTTDAQITHVDRLWHTLRYEPCSERCSNWLRYGVQPRGAKAGMRAGYCRGKAHRREHLGYAGRRVLVSRKWSGKTLGDHRADRRAWVLELLGKSAPQLDTSRYTWEPAGRDDPDMLPLAHRLLLAVAERSRWRAQLDAARNAEAVAAAGAAA